MSVIRRISNGAAVAGLLAITSCAASPARAMPAVRGCTVQVNNMTHHLRNGQLISYPDTQILCVNGTVDIETR